MAVVAPQGRAVGHDLVVEHLEGVGLDPGIGLVGGQTHVDETLFGGGAGIAGGKEDAGVEGDQLLVALVIGCSAVLYLKG